MLIWVGTVLTISTTSSRSAKGSAAESLKSVTNLAILAQQARADETLALIRRGDEDVRKQSYYQRIDTMHQLLNDYLNRDDAIDKSDLKDADQLLARWRQADERINSYIAVGNYQAATQVALGAGDEDSTPAFDRLEQAVNNAIAESRRQLRDDIVNARTVLSGRDDRRSGAQRRRGAGGDGRLVAEDERIQMRKTLNVLAVAVFLLTGCGHSDSMTAEPSMTLAAPTPAGMEEMAPQANPPPAPTDNCDRTASLRPFPDKKDADAAVTNIRQRGRLMVGLDIGSNLFSFRDPITGEITGFDVDIAGEVARDIFGTPSQVEYRILSSADRITALQNNDVDIVVKTMTITCERRKQVAFSSVVPAGQPADSGTAGFGDLAGCPTCPASGCAPPPAPRRSIGWSEISPAADHCVGDHVGRLSRCSAAAAGRRGEHR